MPVYDINGDRRCSGDGPSGHPPHFTSPLNFNRSKAYADGLDNRCRVCIKYSNTRNNPLNYPKQLKDGEYGGRHNLSKRHRRRARKLGVRSEPGITREKVWQQNPGVCHICEKPVGYDEFHADHVIPLNPGTHTLDNLKPAHPACNRIKWRRTMEELETDGTLGRLRSEATERSALVQTGVEG